MLSRANSRSGTRLRRAKSSHSVHYKQDIRDLTTDPKHAEMAAVEAYRRAYKQGVQPCDPRSSSSPPKRRNQTSRRSEGSHFEESRSGKRIGATRIKAPSRSGSVKRTDMTLPPEINGEPVAVGQTVVTRPRRVVETNYAPPTGLTHGSKCQNDTAVYQHVRKARSTYYEPWSLDEDVLRSTSSRHSVPYPNTPHRAAVEKFNWGSEPLGVVQFSHNETRVTTPRETQFDETVKVAAWDAYLQDFHQRRVRGRKSFIAPIKKRLTRDAPPREMTTYDASVPPYNLASESDDVFSPPVPAIEATASLQVEKLRKTRAVSDSLKSKFKRLMSKSKRIQSTLPAQHIEAQSIHFGEPVTDGSSAIMASNRCSLVVPTQCSLSTNTIRTRKSSSRSSNSNGDAATMKSRVTSWTNSTGTGTIRSSGQGGALSSIDESGMLTQPATEPRLGSFLGRALRLPLRRNSRADLHRGSNDSQRLYDALQVQMQEPEEHTGIGMESTINSQTIATETVLKEYLEPRSQGYMDSVPCAETLATPTIWPVQVESPQDVGMAAVSKEAPNRSPPEPPLKVTREASWLRNARQSLPSQIGQSVSIDLGAPGHQQVEDRNPVPSYEQRASRIGRSHNRWQAALEDQSPYTSRPVRYGTNDEDPYRLRSISATPHDEYLPVAVRHSRHADDTPPSVESQIMTPRRSNVISPSVYSQTSERDSKTPEVAKPEYGTFITVTGREVKRYSLDSPSKSLLNDSYVTQPSREWKSWLHSKLGNIGTTAGSTDLTLNELHQASDKSEKSVIDRRSGDRSGNGASAPRLIIDPSHGPSIRAPKLRRPGSETRRSSIMNDRYPLIEKGQGKHNDGTHNKRCHPDAHSIQDSDPPITLIPPGCASSTTATLDPIPSPISLHARVRERHSAVLLGAPRQRTDLARADGLVVNDKNYHSATCKPKSALDLRATYRYPHKMEKNSIDIRRKSVIAILQEDHTLRKISQGPYAKKSPSNKENAAPSRNLSLATLGTLPPEKKEHIQARKAMSTRTSTTRPSPGIDRSRGKESPGQRLADEFLSSRQGITGQSHAAVDRESSPAFM